MKINIPLVDWEFNIPIPPIDKFNEAKEINEKAKSDYLHAQEKVNNCRLKTKKEFVSYGHLKLRVYDTSLRNFVILFDRIKDVDISPIKSSDKYVHMTFNIVDMKLTGFSEIDALKTIVASGGFGAVTGAISFGAVGWFASASTGTAISTLSGAAATNATLAWLGGGSLASGGLGVAGGTAILGGLVTIPIFVVGGLILNAKANAALNDARANRAMVKKFLNEVDTAIAAMNVIRKRINQMTEIIVQVDNLLIEQINELAKLIIKYSRLSFVQKIIKSFKKTAKYIFNKLNIKIPNWLVIENRIPYAILTNTEKEKLMIAVALAQTLKNIVDTNLLDDRGNITKASGDILTKTSKMLIKGLA